MSKQKNKSDLNNLNVAEFQKIFAGTSSFSKRYFENFASEIASAVERMVCQWIQTSKKIKPMMQRFSNS